jgi:predicted amino acid racemase/ketosteroid isomerase-like protein
MTHDARLAVLRRIFDGFNAHDLDTIMAEFEDDCVFDSSRGPEAWGLRFTGKGDARRGLARLFESTPDVRFSDEDHFVSKDRGLSEWTVRGTRVDGTWRRDRAQGQLHEDPRAGVARMLLARLLDRNPALAATAIELHQGGAVPADCYMIDLDAIAENARALAVEAKRLGLRTYVMTKSHNRNPYVTRVALAQGLDSTVVVDTMEARVVNRFGLPVGHAGHLSNIARTAVADILAMEPEVVTVFNHEAARRVSDAATAVGREQPLYVRVNRPGDEFMPGMVGGWTEDECVDGIRPLLDLPNVRVVGLTTFAAVSYQTIDARAAQPTDAFFTMLRAKERLERELGLESLRVNAAGNTNVATFETLARHGATDVEPGIGLLGSSLAHAYGDLPEKPAQVYVSEVMHHWEDEAYLLLGGLAYYTGIGGGPHEYPIRAAVGTTLEAARDNFVTLNGRGLPVGHAVAEPAANARVGDSAVFALRSQLYGNRAPVAIVSGIADGEPRVEALFDSACNALDERYEPLPTAVVRERVQECVTRRYGAPAG